MRSSVKQCIAANEWGKADVKKNYVRWQRAGGFTLIELLVVVAVIALLLSILGPSMQRAKRQAREVVCRSNLHQWGMIWMLYTTDNNGSFPSAEKKGYKRGRWIDFLREQWTDRYKILLCPSASKRPPEAASGRTYGGPFYSYMHGDKDYSDTVEWASYGLNNWVYDAVPGDEDIQGRPTKWNWRKIESRGASNIPLCLDSMWRGGGPMYYDSPMRSEPPEYDGEWVGAKGEMRHFCMDRHRQAVNAVFFDMAVKRIELKQLWKLKWHKEFDTSGWPGPWPEWMKNFKEY